MKNIALASTSALVLAIVSCAPVGPDYAQPEFQPAGNYKSATSSHVGVSSSWWKTFRDPKLNSLQSQLLAQNLDLSAAYARRQQALAQLGIAESNTFPQASASTSINRDKNSLENSGGAQVSEYATQYQIGANLSYEIDLWGRVRRLVEAGRADAQGADFAVADVKNALQTQLARQYFALRFLDAEMATLSAAVKTRQDNLDITSERLEAGLVSELDTARASSELATAKAELLSLKGPRATLENSIAVLLGRQPSSFKISSTGSTGYLPTIPAGVPAALLYRRPDVAVAERKLAAATARIGVAEAERYPNISLGASAGNSTVNTSKFLNWSSAFFGFGPSATVPLFQGGRIKSNIRFTQAQRTEALLNYQKTTLSAFADVESALATLKALRAENSARQSAVNATTRTYDLSALRYKEGATSYLDVADSQREQLTAKRAEVRTKGRQFEATIQLIQALGGGFSKTAK